MGGKSSNYVKPRRNSLKNSSAIILGDHQYVFEPRGWTRAGAVGRGQATQSVPRGGDGASFPVLWGAPANLLPSRGPPLDGKSRPGYSAAPRALLVGLPCQGRDTDLPLAVWPRPTTLPPLRARVFSFRLSPTRHLGTPFSIMSTQLAFSSMHLKVNVVY